ncbi:hypothetical protein AUC68_04060 [Methyloceanibacter methanicus]|uniref:CopL family metal-binding regulatory protein n=1 Tax=Methyloceanibacter methanicus TaxID=1774968 RepID=A0A1E3W0B8_9HYPH|nr:hypothetical protein [Methyloceanibacter methanicus]ODR99193.1 hypothetical protein AUC68_04060 [Methyloceanibacter methanicus]
MARFRTIVTTLIVCALAALPAANASAAVHMAGTMGMTHAMDAAGPVPPAMPADCEKHATRASTHHDAGPASPAKPHGPCSDGACGGKCLCLGLAMSGLLAVAPTTPSLPLAAVRTARPTAQLRAASVVPPSPPPRV